MRIWIAVTVVWCVLLATSCTKQPPEPAPPSNYVHVKNTAEFHTIAKYSTLGEIWDSVGGASAIRSIHTDAKGHNALFQLKHEDSKALWLDFSQGQELVELNSARHISGADVGKKRLFLFDPETEGSLSVVTNKLPSLQHDARWNCEVEGGEMLGVASNPMSDQWWFAVSSSTESEEGGSASIVHLNKVNDILDGRKTSLSCENISLDNQMVCMANGSLLIHSQGFIFLADDTGSQPRRIYSIPDGRQARVYADRTLGNLAWVFLKPRSHGGGTGRSAGEALPGKLTCIDQTGQEKGSIETGSVPFDDIIGDWSRLRCVLLQNSVGIALANLRVKTMSWPLRVRDDIMLFLLPNAGEVWAMLPDAIVGIGIDELIELGSKLDADSVIEGELRDELRPAVETLGWRWSDVQVSPLMSQTGKLTLFDTSDPDSTWSQLDWSISKHRCTGLMIARVPTSGDLSILGLAKSRVEGLCRTNLMALGWDQAMLSDSRLDESEAHLVYDLIPGAKPPLTSGEYQVWITETAAFYSLEGATFEFPSDSLGVNEARSIAVEAFASLAGIAPDSLRVSNLPQAGWLAKENSGWKLLPDAQEGTIPCYRLEAIRDGKSAGLFVIYLDALSGDVLHQVEDRFSPLANLGVIGGKYSKVETELVMD